MATDIVATTETVSHPGEIPVTVHASRTTQGERLHEETRTVAVLPDGAVVRLKASLPPGELVVLTNGQTKSHVICRVKNVKCPPGSREFINLEFIKPTPGFWSGAALRDEGAGREERSGAAPESQTPQRDAVDLPDPAPQSPISGRRPIWRQGGDVHDVRAPIAEGLASSFAATPSSMTMKSEGAAMSPYQIPAATAPLSSDRSSLLDDEDDGADCGSRRSGLRTGVLAIVAVVSIVNGGLLGAWVHKQLTRTEAVPAVAQATVSPPLTEPILSAAGLGSGTVTPASTTGSATAISLRALNGASVSGARETLPGASIEERTPARRSEVASVREPNVPPVVIEKLQAPVRRNAPVMVATVAPPVLSAANAGLGPVGVGLLADPGTGPAPPTPPVGGRLVPLQLISSPQPQYPPKARAQGIEGVVTLEALVDPTGRVVETKVLFGHPLLQDAARATLLGWKYQPARLNGEAIPMYTKVSVRFSLH